MLTPSEEEKSVGENQVFGGSSQDHVGAFLIFSQHEELGALEAADDQVVHLGGGFAPGEPVHVHALDGEELARKGLGRRLKSEQQ